MGNTGHFCSLQNLHIFRAVDCKTLKGGLQAGPAIIEIEIDIEIGKLPEIDCDHDFNFDHDSERPKCENKNALMGNRLCIDFSQRLNQKRNILFSPLSTT